MKNFFIALLLCFFSCKNIGAMLKITHKAVQPTATTLFTPKNLCIAVGLTAGGWYVFKLYQRHLANKRLKEEEMRLVMLQAKFFDAWGQGNAGEVEECIKAGASLRICNTEGQTPLIVSTIQNDLAMVKLFLQYDPESCLLCDNHIKYAYDYAEVLDDKEVMAVLQKAATKILCTILSTGKEAGIVSVTQAVGAGADVNAKNDADVPLVMVAFLDEKIDLAKQLIATGADIDAKDFLGNNLNDIITVFDDSEPMKKAITKALAEREYWKKTVDSENTASNVQVK